jgi:urea transport system ATP-binding protein
MLCVSGLHQFYGESHILWDVELKLEAGAVACIMGRNGVGKTTLLRSILGLLPIASGSIQLAGEELSQRPTHARAAAGLAYVPQGREIFPQLSVEENLRVPLAARRDGSREIPPLVFELFPALQKMLRRRGGDLSGGQQQQLAVARALVADPRLLILDEPTEGIQPNVAHEIGEILRALHRDRGLTILLVEQKLPFARRLADQFFLMEKGRIVGSGPMASLDDALIHRHLGV